MVFNSATEEYPAPNKIWFIANHPKGNIEELLHGCSSNKFLLSLISNSQLKNKEENRKLNTKIFSGHVHTRWHLGGEIKEKRKKYSYGNWYDVMGRER